MENQYVERMKAFKKGIQDVRNGVLSDLRREELKQSILSAYDKEDYSMDALMLQEEIKQYYLKRFEEMDEAYREGMEMATLYPEASIEDLVNLKTEEERRTQKEQNKKGELDQQSSEQIYRMQKQIARDNEQNRTIKKPKAGNKIRRYTAIAGALATALVIAAITIGDKEEQTSRYTASPGKIVTSAPTVKPTEVPLATMEPIPTPAPTAVPNYNVTYNSLQDWYNQNSNDILFRQVFEKYFTYGKDNNMTIGELEKCFDSSYFDGMYLEYEVYKAKGSAIEKGVNYMENFTRDLVKYKVLKAIGDPNLSMESLKTIYASNHTVNYIKTEMVKTKDEKYVFKNEQLPKEIRELINGNGIVQLSNINEDKTSYSKNMILINSAYNTMKNAWGLAFEIVNKDYRVQGASIREVQKDIEVER